MHFIYSPNTPSPPCHPHHPPCKVSTLWILRCCYALKWHCSENMWQWVWKMKTHLILIVIEMELKRYINPKCKYYKLLTSGLKVFENAISLLHLFSNEEAKLEMNSAGSNSGAELWYSVFHPHTFSSLSFTYMSCLL